MKHTRTVILLLMVFSFFCNPAAAQSNKVFENESSVFPAEKQFYSSEIFDLLSNPTICLAEKTKLNAGQTGQERLDSIVYLETFADVIYGGNKNVWEYDETGNSGYWNWYIWNTGTEAWQGVQRADSTFNSNGQLTMIISDAWDNTTGTWIISKKEEFTYDTEGRVVLITSLSWNKTTAAWQPYRKSEITYSSTPTISRIVNSITTVVDNASGEWKYSHRNTQNYDANGNMTLYNSSFYDTVSATWIFTNRSFQYENTYNESGKQTLSGYYVWDESVNKWKGQGDLVETVYDGVGNTTRVVGKEWDNTAHQWINSTKTEFLYANDNQLLQEIDFQWEASAEAWINKHKTENTYNEKNLLVAVIVSDWDILSSSWKMNSQQEVSYDVNDKETLKEFYEPDDTETLALVKKITTDYDTYGNITLASTYEPEAGSSNFIKTFEVQYTFDSEGEKLIEEAMSMFFDGIPYIQKTNFYYSTPSTSTSLEGVTDNQLIYPNPFNNRLMVGRKDNLAPLTVELVNVQGKMMLSTGLLHSTTIDVEHLPDGVYFYRIITGNHVRKGSLLKK